VLWVQHGFESGVLKRYIREDSNWIEDNDFVVEVTDAVFTRGDYVNIAGKDILVVVSNIESVTKVYAFDANTGNLIAEFVVPSFGEPKFGICGLEVYQAIPGSDSCKIYFGSGGNNVYGRLTFYAYQSPPPYTIINGHFYGLSGWDGITTCGRTNGPFQGTIMYQDINSSFDVSDPASGSGLFTATYSACALAQQLGISAEGQTVSLSADIAWDGDWDFILLKENGRLRASIKDGSTWKLILTSKTSWAADEWYHLIFEFGSNGMRMWLNGVLESDTDPTTADLRGSNNLEMGTDTSDGDQFFNGVYDEVHIIKNHIGSGDDYPITWYNSLNDAYDGGFFSIGPEETTP